LASSDRVTTAPNSTSAPKATAAQKASSGSRAPRSGTPTGSGPDLSWVIGAGFVLWGLFIGLGQISDNSFFTHVATGRLILDGGIPRHDPYSFTALGEPWVVQSWLASWLYGWVDSWWGPDGLRVLMGLTTAGLAAMVWALTRPAKGLVGRIVITGLVLGVGTSVWAPRPLLLGLLLLGLTLLVAEGRLPPPVLLPALWIWVNVHGSFPLALVALGALAIGRKLDGDHPAIELRALAWAAGGVALGILNPLGPVLVIFPVRMLQRQEVLQQIIEWQSPSFSSGWARLFLVQVLVAVLLLVRRPSYRAAVPLVVFTAAALLGVRNAAVASLVIVPGMAYGLAGLGTITGTERRGRGAVAALVVMALLGGLLVVNATREPAYDLRTYPVDALAWTGEAGWMIPTVNTATQETVGNALELLEGADARVYIDDRVDMYPKEVVEDFLTLLRGRPGWEEVLAQDAVDVVVWDAHEPLASLLAADPAWRIPYNDGRWFVACRRSSPAIAAAASAGAQPC
jgi:hypothetical protein